MKKLLTAIVISALCLGLCSGALAEGENVISADEFNGSAQPTAAPGEESAVCNPEEAGKVQRVFDLAELLTDDEEAELQSRINELVAKDGQDIGIVTVEDESVMSTQEFADEFYENSGMGIGENRTGVLFCIDMYNRETYLTTTGDMIDISMRPLIEENMASELRRLNAPVYACLGNHEYYSGEPQAQKFFADAGITLLRDSMACAGQLCVIGRDDRTNSRRRSVAELMRRADKSRYTILLDHQPYHLDRAERAGVDFQLSGHTHRGQLWPISWITDRIYECSYGPWQRGNTQYYVSSGLGIWGGKFRIGTCSEYVVATIKGRK